jgi:hypothetical protein
MKSVKPTDIKICRFLRARNPYGMSEGGENPWFMLDDGNTISWCIKSMTGSGPDNGPVDPKLCQEGRKCYQAPD